VIEPMAPHKTVLVVEDDAALRGLLSLVIEARDYRVDTACDGREALDKVRERRPDAIVLDLRLPTMNGDEVMRRLRADARFADIPIILVSAVGGHEAVRRRAAARRAGTGGGIAGAGRSSHPPPPWHVPCGRLGTSPLVADRVDPVAHWRVVTPRPALQEAPILQVGSPSLLALHAALCRLTAACRGATERGEWVVAADLEERIALAEHRIGLLREDLERAFGRS
jgi:CheY-like chemotaxis protein